MKVINVRTNNVVSDRDVTKFIEDSMNIGRVYEQALGVLNDAINGTGEVSMMARTSGIDIQDIVIIMMEQTLASADLVFAQDQINKMSFGEGTVTTKLLRAITQFADFKQEVALAMAASEPWHPSRYQNIERKLKYAIGDWYYSLYSVFNVDMAILADGEGEQVMPCPAINEYLVRAGISFKQFCTELMEKSEKYIGAVPVLFDKFDIWEKMHKEYNASAISTLVDYSEWVYPTDIALYTQGKLDMSSDEYQARLLRRWSNQSLLVNLYTDEWWEFIRKVPDEFAQDVYDLEFDLTIGLITPVLDGETPDKEFFDGIRKFVYGETGGFTNHFGG